MYYSLEVKLSPNYRDIEGIHTSYENDGTPKHLRKYENILDTANRTSRTVLTDSIGKIENDCYYIYSQFDSYQNPIIIYQKKSILAKPNMIYIRKYQYY